MMRNSISVDVPWCPGAVPSPTYTPTSQKRRSFCGVPSSLKPARGKLPRFWPGSKSPAIGPEFTNWNKSDLSVVIRDAGCQMGSLGNPANALPPIDCASKWIDLDELHFSKSETENKAAAVPRKALPPPPVPASPPMPVPTRAPPPPPIPELSPVAEDIENKERKLPPKFSTSRASASRSRQASGLRRRAKTPVHTIGQLERAAKQKNSGVSRTSSVSTIARQYRELVAYPDDSDIPEVPSIDPKFIQRRLSKAEREDVELHFPGDSRTSERLASPRHRTQLTPSPVSDDGTLVASEEYATKSKPLSYLPPLTPPPELRDARGTEDPAALRLQVGLQLLTRELSSAMASQSSQNNGNPSGLQVWVMIEAYERLRDQIAGSAFDSKEARSAIACWLEALHAIHRSIADEEAGSESEYEDESVTSE